MPHNSPINLTPIANLDDENPQRTVLDIADQSVVADAVLPQASELRAFERFTDAAWVV